MSKLTIVDVKKFLYIKRQLKELRMRIKDHTGVIASRVQLGRKHEAVTYEQLNENARKRQQSLHQEVLDLRRLINSKASNRRLYDSYIAMVRLMGRDDIDSITINHPHGYPTTPPNVQVRQMLKLTQQDLLLDLDATTLTEDERILQRIARDEASITVKEALVLSRQFNTGVDYWLDKQKVYDAYLLKQEKTPTYIIR